MSLATIAEAVSSCTNCGLHRDRKNAVPGGGPEDASIMLVGEAPGAAEDESGEPFVGMSGILLNRLLKDAGIARTSIFVTNSVKCRPEGNRDPTGDEVTACKDYLIGQIQVLQPKVIITVGKFAAWRVTMTTGPISNIMALTTLSCLYGSEAIPVIACYHPAYLLRLLQSQKERGKKVYLDYIERLKRAAAVGS
tara:strand:- start:738 stop:1319 length:582 start_codon:yes stop_codon:yes gene_type:complete